MHIHQIQRAFIFFILITISLSTKAAPIGAGDIVTVGSKEWAQVSLFTNLSWNTMNAACPAGVCSGTLNGHDVGGWIWASIFDVGDLFSSVTPYPGGISSYFENNSTWAPGFFDTLGFDPTETLSIFRTIKGLTATEKESLTGQGAVLTDRLTSSDPKDVVGSNLALLKTATSSKIGGWFYRSASVPEPSSFILLTVGLIGLGISRRRQ